MPCRAHLVEVTDHVEQFRALNCDIIVVVQARPEILKAFLERNPQPVQLISDPDRNLYRQFGLERVSWWTFFRPKVIVGYLKAWRHGQRIRKPYPGEDVRQLGGDFLLTRDGQILYSYRNPDPTERPTVTELLQIAGQNW